MTRKVHALNGVTLYYATTCKKKTKDKAQFGFYIFSSLDYNSIYFLFGSF